MRVVIRRIPRPFLVYQSEEISITVAGSIGVEDEALYPRVPPPTICWTKPFVDTTEVFPFVAPPGPGQTSGYYSTIQVRYGRRIATVWYGDEVPNNFTAAPLPGTEDWYEPYVKPTVYQFRLSSVFMDDEGAEIPSFSNLRVEDDTYLPYVAPKGYVFRYDVPFTDELPLVSAPLQIQEDWYIPGYPYTRLIQTQGLPLLPAFLLSIVTPQEGPFVPPTVLFGSTGFCAKYGTGVKYGSGRRYCDNTRKFLQFVADPPLLGVGGWGGEWNSMEWGGNTNITTQSFVNVQRLSVKIHHFSAGLFVIARIRPIAEDGGVYPWNYEAFSDFQLVQRCSVLIRHSDDSEFVINRIRPITEISKQEPIG